MSAIQVTYLGAMHCKGNGKNGPYDFCQIKYATALEPVQSEKRTVVAYGWEESTLDLDVSSIHQFANLKPGSDVVIEVGPNPRNMNRNICTGVIKEKASA